MLKDLIELRDVLNKEIESRNGKQLWYYQKRGHGREYWAHFLDDGNILIKISDQNPFEENATNKSEDGK